MSVSDNASRTASFSSTGQKFNKLNLDQVRQIDEALASIGDYGEVHLILQHGELSTSIKWKARRPGRTLIHDAERVRFVRDRG